MYDLAGVYERRCGTLYEPQDLIVQSKANVLNVHFVSDGAMNFKGFLASYEEITGTRHLPPYLYICILSQRVNETVYYFATYVLLVHTAVYSPKRFQKHNVKLSKHRMKHPF